MNIAAFLDGAPRGTAAAIARSLGVHPVMVSQWASGLKDVPAERCAAIEQATTSMVRRWDLRPDDWHRIWPELIGVDGAPDVSACDTATTVAPAGKTAEHPAASTPDADRRNTEQARMLQRALITRDGPSNKRER